MLNFQNVAAILQEYFDERHIAFLDIQPTSLGQALVCFNSPVVRDSLVLHSPMNVGNVQMTFTRHQQGRNWRRINFNLECWLMLLDFPLDYWDSEYIQDAICSFGRVENWINNRTRLARLMVKVRVADLQSVPHWIVFSDGVGDALDSWSVQVEIFNHNLVAVPLPEEPFPHHIDHLAPYDFFGFGQPGAGPVA